MMPATVPEQRPAAAKLLVADTDGRLTHWRRGDFVQLFRKGDLVIANDAATLPASLHGQHVRSRREIEVRLAGRDSLEQVKRFSAVLFGAGDYRIRTEDRPVPPPTQPGDRLILGPLRATVVTLHHPRLVTLELEGSTDTIWEGLARHGRPIQYAHMTRPLRLWDTWTPIAGRPVAFEPPSSGFMLDWAALGALMKRGVRFATITHAAGISSTGDAALDALLPFDEPYRIPASTAKAIRQARALGTRIIAIGTSVVRALEHAATLGGPVVRAGDGVASQRIGGSSRLTVVSAILSGTHEPGTSHYDMLRAFVDETMLTRISRSLDEHGYLTHEFGDSVFIERATR